MKRKSTLRRLNLGGIANEVLETGTGRYCREVRREGPSGTWDLHKIRE